MISCYVDRLLAKDTSFASICTCSACPLFFSFSRGSTLIYCTALLLHPWTCKTPTWIDRGSRNGASTLDR